MQLLPSSICFTFSSFWLLFCFNAYLKNIRFLVYLCVDDIINSNGRQYDFILFSENVWQHPCWTFIPGAEPWILISSFLFISVFSVLPCLFSRKLQFLLQQVPPKPKWLLVLTHRLSAMWCWSGANVHIVHPLAILGKPLARHGAACYIQDSAGNLSVCFVPSKQCLLASAYHTCWKSLVQGHPALCMSSNVSYE